MKLKFKKNVYKDGKSFVLLDIENPNSKTIALFEKYLLDILSDDLPGCYESFPLGDSGEIGVYIVRTTSVDEGDYDYDDVYTPCYTDFYEYYPCNFCPITGEKIEVEVVETEDYTDVVEKLQNDIKNLNKYTRKSKVEEREKLHLKLDKICTNNFSKLSQYM